MSHTTPAHLKHFVDNPRPSGPIFIGLNLLRGLSLASLILVFCASIVTMVADVNAIKGSNNVAKERQTTRSTTTVSKFGMGDSPALALRAIATISNSSSFSNDTWNCDYYRFSTVPRQAGGQVWSILNRLFILMSAFLLFLSEIGFPRVLFTEYIPMLGPNHGLGCLGVLQALLGASVLSHFCSLFTQVSSWLLFIIGCFNIMAGIFLREKAKSKRLLFKWENYANITPQTRLAASAWDAYKSYNGQSAQSSGENGQGPKVAGQYGEFGYGGHYKTTSTRNGSSTNDHYATQLSDEPSRPRTTKPKLTIITPIRSPVHSRTRSSPLSSSGGHNDKGHKRYSSDDSAAYIPGSKFGGFGFGRQADPEYGNRWKITKPADSLPKYHR